jgi:hypothetical protein
MFDGPDADLRKSGKLSLMLQVFKTTGNPYFSLSLQQSMLGITFKVLILCFIIKEQNIEI